MVNNSIAYGPGLKKIKFEELKFTEISTAKVTDIVYDKQLKPEPNTFAFRNSLLAAFSAEVGINVLQINLFLTPKQPEFDGLGFFFLEDKSILPVKLNQSPAYKAWSNYITNEPMMGEPGPFDWMLEYSKDKLGMSGASYESNGKTYTVKDDEVYTETGKYLFENSPKKFNEKQIAADKWKYIKKYINTSGQNLDLSETTQLFNQLLGVNGVKGQPVAGNITECLAAFKTLTGYDLPPELATVYRISDGLTFESERAYHFLSISKLLNEWKTWNEIYTEWLLEDLKVHKSDENQTLPMYTTPYWIPFMTRDGNNIAIDYAPGKKGLSGQIIVFGADEQEIKVLAPNFNDFISMLGKKNKSLSFYTGSE